MSMHPFFQELRAAREAKGLTLAQISDITRIAESHLEALERGEVSILPQAYVRAFIREYAEMVGLKPDEVMRKYDAMLLGVTTPPPMPQTTPAPAPPTPAISKPERWTAETILTARNARTAFFATLLVGLGVILWNTVFRQTPATTEEIPFQSILADKEKRLASPQTQPMPAAPVTPPGVPSDSLTLRGLASDTVWVMMITDQEPPKEFIFKPNTRFTFKARDRFSITLGNAGVVEFTLNQKNLGTLGKRGAVLRSYELTRAALSTR
jgi:transcriptional regulator with XRE-family HTH domain